MLGAAAVGSDHAVPGNRSPVVGEDAAHVSYRAGVAELGYVAVTEYPPGGDGPDAIQDALVERRGRFAQRGSRPASATSLSSFDASSPTGTGLPNSPVLLRSPTPENVR
jgi:hypothetical protein